MVRKRPRRPNVSPARDLANQVNESVTDAIGGAVAAVKPRLRGWLHLGTFPLAVAAGIVLVVLAPTTGGRVSAIVFTVCSGMLFGTSALYHRGTWSPKVRRLLKRMD